MTGRAPRRDNIKVGEVYSTNFSGEIEVIENTGKGYHRVRFRSDGLEMRASGTNILEGSVKNKNTPKLYKQGFIGYGIYSKVKDENAYNKWAAMLQRCYGKGRDNPRYIGCTVCDRWKSFQLFAEDFYNMKGCDNIGWHMDKDIIKKGNRIYCPEFCSIVPSELNNIILSSNATRGKYPVGVHLDKKKPIYKYVAEARMHSRRTYVGAFKTTDEAFSAYKSAKEAYIKEVVSLWQKRIDKRVYESLVVYEVSIND